MSAPLSSSELWAIRRVLDRFRDFYSGEPALGDAPRWDPDLHRMIRAQMAGGHDQVHGIASGDHSGFPGDAALYLDGTGAFTQPPGGGGGGVTDADYLVGTAHGDLSAEIVVGTTPGGELGGTWAAPTVDAIHSGSAHHTQDHAARHASGAADPITAATPVVVKKSGVSIGTRRGLNLIEGSNVTLTVADDLANDEVDVTIASSGGGGGGGEGAYLTPVGVAVAAATDTTLRTAAGNEVWWLDVANRANASITFRVAIRPGGVALTRSHYRFYEVTLQADQALRRYGPYHLVSGDVVTVRASGVASFGLDGYTGTGHFTPKVALPGTAGSWVKLFTAGTDSPAGTDVRVYLDIANVSDTNDAEVSVAVVPAGGTPVAANERWTGMRVSRGEFLTRFEDGPFRLVSGAELWVASSLASGLAFSVDGRTR